MKTRELTILSSVVAAIAATTYFTLGLKNSPLTTPKPTQITTAPSVAKESQSDLKIADESANVSTQEKLMPVRNQGENRRQKQTASTQKLAAAHTDNREKVVNNLQRKLSLLETQYGVLSIDDIALLQASLADIDQLDTLIDLSNAVDELMDQP